jgi:hypothetical protein
LVPAFPVAGSSKNPFAHFVQEMDKHNLNDWVSLPEEAKNWEKGQEPALQAYLDRHVAERTLFNELMSTDPALWRWQGVDESINHKMQFSDLTPCLTVASQLGKTEIILLERAGRHVEATEKALQLARFGNRLTQIDGALLHRLVAVTVQRMGEQQAKTPLMSTTDEGCLRQAQEALALFHGSSSSLARMLQVEFLFCKNSPPIPDEAAMAFWGANDWERVAITHLTLPNRTAAEHCDLTRRLIQASNQDWMTVIGVNHEIASEESRRFSEGWKLFLRPNLGGKIILRHGWSSTRIIISKACAGEALHRMTIVTIALRRHELAHGRLPATLRELVPTYLPEVPLDPFDGQPLRWDATKKWLYSVSENQRDNHGAHDTPEKTHSGNPDLVMPYWWLPEPATVK